ncbi:MAG TPA: CopD family protein [Tepidisphaeraceae bacterium]|jgi:putative copper export protein|nr:CopD family protein [Tepidisphaeraceae bacterium]
MDEAISGPLAAARGVHLASCVLLLAVWIFDKWIIAGSADPRIGQSSRRIGRWLLAIALSAALFSGIAWFYYVAAGMKDPDEPITRTLLKLVWTDTQFGHVWQLRVVLLIAAAVVSLFLFSRRACSPRPSGSPATEDRGEQARRLNEKPGVFRTFAHFSLGVLAVALLASIAWAGHGATGPVPHWHRAADVLHLLVCAAWPGGLIPLGLLLWHFARVHEQISLTDAAAIIRRFSATALASVILLTLTGTLNAWCLVGSFPGLWNTRYGQTLLLKLAVFLVIIALGATNLLIGKPRLLRLAIDPPTDSAALSLPIIRRMASIVIIEAILALGIFAIVGILGLLMPARM